MHFLILEGGKEAWGHHRLALVSSWRKILVMARFPVNVPRALVLRRCSSEPDTNEKNIKSQPAALTSAQKHCWTKWTMMQTDRYRARAFNHQPKLSEWNTNDPINITELKAIMKSDRIIALFTKMCV